MQEERRNDIEPDQRSGFRNLNRAGHAAAQGFYDPAFEHDSCGVGFIADIGAEPRHDVVEDAVRILIRLEHRGAVAADGVTGDGAGLLMGIPDEFFRSQRGGLDFDLPAAGDYAAGMVFLPIENKLADACMEKLEEIATAEGAEVLGWREVPTEAGFLGHFARSTMPRFRQVFLDRKQIPQQVFERKLLIIRRQVENAVKNWDGEEDFSQFYIASLSSRSIVYKGMLVGSGLTRVFPDLQDPQFKTPYAIVHQRYSTNTLPTWSLAQPLRMLAHNGEINTLQGNFNRMRARESGLASPLFGDDIEKIKPVVSKELSDSATLDNVLELLVLGGRSLPHSMMMLVPEAWGKSFHISEDKRAFYEYHSAFMEPWDGPAAMAFTDGRYIGANLDRNGLRPARYTITNDNLVIMASETGVLDLPSQRIRQHGRLQPGRIFLVDLQQHRLVPDREIKSRISRQTPYRRWVRDNKIELRGLQAPATVEREETESLRIKQVAFGYTEEELRMLIAPMTARGQEAVGSMGTDVPLAVLSHRPQMLFTYFKQQFAQVTNPAIDPLREELVMSLMSFIGRERNLLAETPEHCRLLKLPHPVLTSEDMQRIRNADNPDIQHTELDILYPVEEGGGGLENALETIYLQAEEAVRNGSSVLILTDKRLSRVQAPIPSLLAAAGLHHYLIRRGLRTRAGIIVETGEAREVIHFAMLIAYGVNAVCPYLALASVREIADEKPFDTDLTAADAIDNYIAAVKKGLLKTLSRMGISTIRSFFGSQIFEAVGLNRQLAGKYFTGTVSRIEGAGLKELAEEVGSRHQRAFPGREQPPEILDAGGDYHLRRDGEKHLWSQETLPLFQRAVRNGSYEIYQEFADKINDQSRGHLTLRSLIDFNQRTPVQLAEVEAEESLMKRFYASAMSFGSVSPETHESIAVAMNRIGASSNCGEGGEDPARYELLPNGDDRKSRVKQVASGRFGVTIEYLINCEELQIKVAQGAKPGEGGQLPGHKVSAEIAHVRHTTPGVTLISPPPHHDIYSIEDLKQLIRDLKCANPNARVSVKLVSEVGVGTIAAGVAKAKADMVHIAGYDGGTGASPLTAIKHTGVPWELGLTETQQTLMNNGLRGNIRVQVDGQLRTGRDLAVAALMGAEEFGFGTPLLVCLGCVMMRKCHANNCPVGVATQDPQLRERFTGKPEYIENYMRFLARDLREHMAKLGFRTLDEMIGHPEVLRFEPAIDHWKNRGVDLTPLLRESPEDDDSPRHCSREMRFEPVECFDDTLLPELRSNIRQAEPVKLERTISNTDRTIGARISGEIARRYGLAGLPEDTLELTFSGTAGQSFGAFLAEGVSLRLYGDANDYVGKGMNGGKIIIQPPVDSPLRPAENVIAGNVILYGATGGEVYINGLVGERFAIRNSGAHAVVEGVGDHACEYMTGGVVVVLGGTGYNFAAGMSGGAAYVYDESGLFDTRCNLDMVDIETPWSREDRHVLRRLLENHVHYTNSERAAVILENWETHLPCFVKVMPIEYRKVLERMADKEERESETVSATEEVFSQNSV